MQVIPLLKLKGMRLRLFVLLLGILNTSAISAQNIRFTGKVINEKNEPVTGASVKVAGTELGTATSVDGYFSLNFTAGQKYTIEISAIGYATKRVTDIEVAEGGLNELTIVLEIEAKLAGDAIVIRTVSRRQENTNSLLTFQRNSTSLSNGLAADFIRRTPDRNTSDVLKRVSGASIQDNRFVVIRGLSDRYNAAVINNAQLPSTEPDKKAFSFDIIPSALIDNIIINKTATPDLPGEFAGGLIQINTKDIPTRNMLSVGISLGYNTQSTFRDFISNKRNGSDWTGFDNGTRSLPDGFPSSAQQYRALGGTLEGLDKQFQYSRLFNNDVYAEVMNKARPVQSYSLTWGNTARFENGGKFGTIVSLSYRNSMNSLNEIERRLNEKGGVVNTRVLDNSYRYGVNVGGLANFTYVKGKHKVSFKNLFNQLFEDNYYTRSGVSIDRGQDLHFSSSVLNQRTLYSGQLEGEHQLNQDGVRFQWNLNGAYNWKTQPDLRTVGYFRPSGTNAPFEMDNDDSRRFYSDLKDFSYGANGSLVFPFEINERKQTVKVGGSTLIRIRDFRSRIFKYDIANLSQFDATKLMLPSDQIFAPQNMGMDGFVINEFTNNQDKYFGVSALNGMFAMFDNKVGDQLRLIWGIRVENFQQVLSTKDVTAKRIVIETEKWDVLPSVNITFSTNAKSNIRLAGSRTVSRPEFREIAPFSFFDYEVNYAVNGNPDLKRGSILNGDIRYEYYPKAGEAITFGAFYKSFDDPIELSLDPGSVVNRRTYGYRNADKAYSLGAELEVRKGLGSFNHALEALSVFANLTYIYSQVTIPSTTGAGENIESDRPLQGQSPYLINAGLQYNDVDNGWSGSILYNRIGQRLALVGNTEYPDIYERPRNQVDLQIGKRLMNNKAELKLTVSDLLNSPYYFYENIDDKKAFSMNNDYLFYKYKQGTNITLGFTYDFNL